MNKLIEDNAIEIILMLVIFIFILMGIMIYILYRLLLKQSNLAVLTNHQNIPTNGTEVNLEVVKESFYCPNHPETPTVASCLICEDVFCENCMVEHEGMYFCKDHFKIYANHKWKQITDVKTTPNTPEDGLHVYAFKRKLWKEKGIPSFVLTHYKINIEYDYIESFIQLNVREEESDQLLKELDIHH